MAEAEPADTGKASPSQKCVDPTQLRSMTTVNRRWAK